MKTIKDYLYSYNHVKQRLKERHNIDIDRREYSKMNLVVRLYRQANHINPISVDNNGDQEVWEYMEFNEKYVKVVYSVSKERITTVLPEEEI